MSGNSFGNLFRITTFGESHGFGIGCIIDGCPPLIEISENEIQLELNRRRPNQSKISTSRNEEDVVEILSGTFEGKTTGTPICLLIKNKDHKSEDYNKIKDIFRPGHADFTYQMKYGIRDYRGGGRSSARETIARVAAGAIAKKYLTQNLGIKITAYTHSIGNIECDTQNINLDNIEKNIVRCADLITAEKMISLIEEVKIKGDSVGGIVRCIVENCPIGIGEPVFDKISAVLAHAMMSINAVKGFEIGSGFEASKALGSENNDEFLIQENNIRTKTNHSGGILGGITNGENIDFKVSFKPVSTIQKQQNTINTDLNNVQIEIKEGRHDPCVVPRAIPIVEAMTALTIIDLYLIHRAYERTG